MEQQNINRWEHLISQYLNDQITREELDELLHSAAANKEMPSLSAVMRTYWEKASAEKTDNNSEWEEKFQRMMLEAKAVAPFEVTPVRTKMLLLKRFIAAASVLLLLGMAGYFLLRQEKAPTASPSQLTAKQDIVPGSTGAILTLANGEKIVLDSAGNGVLAVQGKTKLINRNGQILYDGEDRENAGMLYNTITTPRGRQYTLMLADGSKVWLNAASSLRYPATFSGEARKVEVTGEAYFEIAHSKVPFVVNVRGMEVQVLGTHFNINAYEDEAAIQTTLLEGSVKVSKSGRSRVLQPGQQSLVSGDAAIKVQDEVNTDVILAWKNGYFSFDQTDLYAVMRQISRWYDVDVVYEGNIPDRRFGGEISRNANASQVLQILEESNIHFKIIERKIVVLP